MLKAMAQHPPLDHPCESVTLLSWQVDAAHNGLSFSAAYQRYSGSDDGALRGAGWREGLHSADADAWPQAWSMDTSVDIRLRRADGVYRWMRVGPVALEGTLASLCGIDVTDLIDAYDEATQELAQQHEIFNQIPAFVVVKDANNKILRSNRSADRYFLGSDASMEGRHSCDMFPEDIARTWQKQDRAVIDSGEPLLGLVEEFELHGRRRWHRMNKVPFKYSGDGSMRVLVLGTDISDEKMLELRLREQIEDSASANTNKT
jgi:PAS domain S-box-containing protein